MREPRRSWREITRRLEIRRHSPEEEVFIRDQFPGLNAGTFECDLSRKFSSEHASSIRRVCEMAGFEYDADSWIRMPALKRSGRTVDEIRFSGGPMASSEAFYDQLAIRYRLAQHYDCVRVGGLFSRNRTSFSKFDEDGLALEPNAASIRMPYLRIFWQRMKEKRLSGNSVHVVRTIDRLVELWACAELLRSLKLHETNQLYLAPIAPPPSPDDYPVMGVRVIDGAMTLLSIPAPKLGESRYSSWIESERLAEFAAEYVRWARFCSDEITNLPSVGIEEVMTKAFGALRHVETQSANFGRIDSIAKAKVVKSRMIDLALAGSWFPVVA